MKQSEIVFEKFFHVMTQKAHLKKKKKKPFSEIQNFFLAEQQTLF